MKNPQFGTWLQARMAELGLTQQQLAERVGVSQQQISRYIEGEVPRAERVGRLADGLGVTVYELVKKAEVPTEMPPDDRQERRARLDHWKQIEEEARRRRQELEAEE